MLPFYIPWKCQKTFGFLVYSWAYKMGTLDGNELREVFLDFLNLLTCTDPLLPVLSWTLLSDQSHFVIWVNIFKYGPR